MSTRNRTPPLLEPYLRLPSEASQLLLTGVLDSSPQWLVTRLLRSAFTPLEESESESPEEQNVSVILVSWLRDYDFWKSEARRGAGIDLARLAQQDKFVFVDGLTHLFPVATSNTAAAAPSPVASSATKRSLPVRNTRAAPAIPNRGGPLPSRGPIPSRGPPPTPSQNPQPQPTQPPSQLQSTQPPTKPTNQSTLQTNSLPSTYKTLSAKISRLLSLHPNQKIHLILDSPTTLLSTSASPSAYELSNLILSLRQQVTTTTLVVEADFPFLSAAIPDIKHNPTPLEAAHAAFAVQQAHVSEWVIGLRPLDTGKARDVSGVVRVARGGAWNDHVEDEGEKEKVHEKKELEALYFVQNDGGVRVFERGEASVG